MVENVARSVAYQPKGAGDVRGFAGDGGAGFGWAGADGADAAGEGVGDVLRVGMMVYQSRLRHEAISLSALQ